MMDSSPTGNGYPIRDGQRHGLRDTKGVPMSRPNQGSVGVHGNLIRTSSERPMVPTMHGQPKTDLRRNIERAKCDNKKVLLPVSRRFPSAPQPQMTRMAKGLRESKSVSRAMCKSPFDAKICKETAMPRALAAKESLEPTSPKPKSIMKQEEDKVKPVILKEVPQPPLQDHVQVAGVVRTQQNKQHARKAILEVMNTEQFQEALRKNFKTTLKESLKLHMAGRHKEASESDKSKDCAEEFEETLTKHSREMTRSALNLCTEKQPDDHPNSATNINNATTENGLEACTELPDGTDIKQHAEDGNSNKRSFLKRFFGKSNAKVAPLILPDENMEPKRRSKADLERIAAMFCVETEVEALCRRYSTGNNNEEDTNGLFPRPGVWECEFDDNEPSRKEVVDDLIDLEIYDDSSEKAEHNKVDRAVSADKGRNRDHMPMGKFV